MCINELMLLYIVETCNDKYYYIKKFISVFLGVFLKFPLDEVLYFTLIQTHFSCRLLITIVRLSTKYNKFKIVNVIQ